VEGFAKQFEITTINLNARSLRSLKTQRDQASLKKHVFLKKASLCASLYPLRLCVNQIFM